MSVNDFLYSLLCKKIDWMTKNLDKVTEEDKRNLEKLYEKVCKVKGISENGKWVVTWVVNKFKNMQDYLSNTPYDTVIDTQNIILDNGANEMLKIICGTGGRPYSNANAKIQVGTNTTPELASQTGLIATSPNMYEKGMEATYPQVSGRTMVFKSVFDDGEANFAWNEFSITNGNVSLNRKVQNLGTKNTGVWSIQITISVTST